MVHTSHVTVDKQNKMNKQLFVNHGAYTRHF